MAKTVQRIFQRQSDFKPHKIVTTLNINFCYKDFFRKYRSSHPEVFLRKGVLEKWSKFTREHPCRSAISIKLLCNWLLLAILTNPQFPATLFILRNAHWKMYSICPRFLSYQIIYWSILSRFVINCSPIETDTLSDRSEIREGYTVKFFFQSISWNTVSGSFHETWNTFMKCFYFSIQHSLRMFLINKKLCLQTKDTV